MRFAVAVEVRALDGVADPAGLTIGRALPALGFGAIEGVRVGKLIRFSIEAGDEEEAQRVVRELCDRLLANPVIETASIAIDKTEAVIT
jgi:phosphoribosylformylglycinamidine synthase subunit PurS